LSNKHTSVCAFCGTPLREWNRAAPCVCRECRCLAAEQDRAEQLDYIRAGFRVRRSPSRTRLLAACC